MAKETDNPETEQEESVPKPQARETKIDDCGVMASYANFCRVTGTPEEMIIDFALNPQPMGPPAEPLVIDRRLILNFYTAKRTLAALQMAVQRHEAAFGVLETDVRKRVTRQAPAQT